MEGLNGIIAWAVSLLLTIGVVWKAVSKFSPKIKKSITIAKESLDLLDTVLKAVEDQKVDELEVAKIREEANSLIAAIKAYKS